jgi:hypothetical protein
MKRAANLKLTTYLYEVLRLEMVELFTYSPHMSAWFGV